MESEMTFSYNKPFNSSQNNSGLLRFRSVPSSFLANWDGKSEKNEDETSCFPSSRTQSIHEASQLVQNMEEDNALNSQFRPQYPRTKYRAQKLDLMRENSTTTAELFSPFSAQNGYASLKSVGGYGFPGGEVEFSSPVQSTLGMLSRITEVENETIGLNTHDREPPYYGSGMPFSSWNHSTKFGDNFSGLKTELDCDDEKLISDIQGGGELRNRPHMLSHHYSIPKASSTHEFATMDKFLHFQDSVPCKLRAKRGCATHPRSIAERVRRTRISERMRKLQELVPNMEKQTNTSDMLDFAVDYIKELQKQYKSLSDIRARCKCSSAMQKQPVSDQKY